MYVDRLLSNTTSLADMIISGPYRVLKLSIVVYYILSLLSQKVNTLQVNLLYHCNS